MFVTARLCRKRLTGRQRIRRFRNRDVLLHPARRDRTGRGKDLIRKLWDAWIAKGAWLLVGRIYALTKNAVSGQHAICGLIGGLVRLVSRVCLGEASQEPEEF